MPMTRSMSRGPRPETGAGAAGDGVRGGDEGIGAVVEVEEGGLGALEQDLAALVHGVVDHADGVAHHRLDARGVLAQVAVGDVAGVEGQPVVDLGQDGVLLLEHDVELLAEDLGVEEVLDPQADPGRLVGVGGADAALGRAQRVLAEEALGHPVQLLVVRHDQVRVAADDEPAGVDALGGQAVELLEEDGRVHHDAVADDRRDVVVEDAARHQLEGEGLAVDHDAVAGVVATLVADHEVHLASEEVGELALPLVAPLGPDHHGCGHAPLRSLCRSDYAPVYPSPKSGSANWAVFRALHPGYCRVEQGRTVRSARAFPAGSREDGTVANELRDVRVAFVVANEGIEEVELLRPWRTVVDAGGTAELVAPGSGMVETMRHLDRADRFPVDQTTERRPGRRLRRRRPARRRGQPRPAADRRGRRRLPHGGVRGGQAGGRHLPRSVDAH